MCNAKKILGNLILVLISTASLAIDDTQEEKSIFPDEFSFLNMEGLDKDKLDYCNTPEGFKRLREILLRGLGGRVLEQRHVLNEKHLDFAAQVLAFYVFLSPVIKADDNFLWNSWDDAWDQIFEQRAHYSWMMARNAAEKEVWDAIEEMDTASKQLKIEVPRGSKPPYLYTLRRLSLISQEKYLGACYQRAFSIIKDVLARENYSAPISDALLVCAELWEEERCANNPYAITFKHVFTTRAEIPVVDF